MPAPKGAGFLFITLVWSGKIPGSQADLR